jgi:glycosyltransferase involved in cell wall biosynthesis
MKYSIVIPTYNHCDDFLKPCIESIYKFSNPGEFEVVVSANGCTDNTAQYLRDLQRVHNNVKVAWSDEPLGFARSTNRGIELASGEFIVLLNNDTVILDQPMNSWLERLVAPFEDPKMGITGVLSQHSPITERTFLIFFCVMIRRSLFDELGLLDEDFKTGGQEDVEFCYRTEYAEYKLKNVTSISTLSESGTHYVNDFPIWHVGEGTAHDKTLVTIDLEEDSKNNYRLLHSKTRTPLKNKIILKHTYPGLGDNLVHSTLPEIFTNKGYDVYISNQQGYRNDEVKQLIDMNPFIKGYSNYEPTLNVDERLNSTYPITHPNKNYTARVEYSLWHEIYNQYPKIYYTPKFLPEWQDKTFIDFNSESVKWPKDDYLKFALAHNTNCVITRVDYTPKDLFEYIDIINSCKKFLCTYSGSMPLAAAINKRNVECYMPSHWVTDVLIKGGYCYHYDNVNYIAFDKFEDSVINVPELANTYNQFNPLVHIVTATHKRFDKLKKAIDSVRSQTYQNYIHHVVADGHDEDVYYYIKHLGDSRIRYSCVEHEGQLGGLPRMSALNAIRSTDNEYVCFLDDDNTFNQDYLETHIRNIEPVKDTHGISVGKIYMDKFDVFLPDPWDISETEVKFTCIDTLNVMIRVDLAKPQVEKWIHTPGARITHDFDFISAVLATTKLKYTDKIIGYHGERKPK